MRGGEHVDTGVPNADASPDNGKHIADVGRAGKAAAGGKPATTGSNPGFQISGLEAP